MRQFDFETLSGRQDGWIVVQHVTKPCELRLVAGALFHFLGDHFEGTPGRRCSLVRFFEDAKQASEYFGSLHGAHRTLSRIQWTGGEPIIILSKLKKPA